MICASLPRLALCPGARRDCNSIIEQGDLSLSSGTCGVTTGVEDGEVADIAKASGHQCLHAPQYRDAPGAPLVNFGPIMCQWEAPICLLDPGEVRCGNELSALHPARCAEARTRYVHVPDDATMHPSGPLASNDSWDQCISMADHCHVSAAPSIHCSDRLPSSSSAEASIFHQYCKR